MKLRSEKCITNTLKCYDISIDTTCTIVRAVRHSAGTCFYFDFEKKLTLL